MPRIINPIMSYTCMQHLKIEHQDNVSKLASGINSSVYRWFIVFGKKHYVGGCYDGSTEDKGVSYARISCSKLKDYCLIKFIDSVMKMNLDDEISMIQSLQSIYNMFKVGKSDILGISMTFISKKSIYVRIQRKKDYYITMEKYKTIQY